MHATCKVGTNEAQPKEKSKGCSKGVRCNTCILAETQRQAEEWQSCVMKKRGDAGVPAWRPLAQGSCRQASSRAPPPCDWLGEHIWLSLVGPKLEAGTTFGEVFSY